MNIEIERRFLLNCKDFNFDISKIFNKKITSITLERITQFYFKNNTPDISQRVRCIEYETTHKCVYSLNIKSNIDNISRNEFETTISKDDFNFMTKYYCDKVLSKYRFNCIINKKKWELNYLPTKNLLLIEIELKNKNTNLNIPFKFAITPAN